MPAAAGVFFTCLRVLRQAIDRRCQRRVLDVAVPFPGRFAFQLESVSDDDRSAVTAATRTTVIQPRCLTRCWRRARPAHVIVCLETKVTRRFRKLRQRRVLFVQRQKPSYDRQSLQDRNPAFHGCYLPFLVKGFAAPGNAFFPPFAGFAAGFFAIAKPPPGPRAQRRSAPRCPCEAFGTPPRSRWRTIAIRPASALGRSGST